MARWDVAVVGLGHAGVEAALAAARLGARVVAVTQVASKVGLMSCNPAIGGPGKSQLVREIDVCGGAMALAADRAALQVLRLNASKGPSAWATRIQVDRLRYSQEVQALLRTQPGLEVVQGEVVRLREGGGKVTGLELASGERLEVDSVILTTGTFLRARLHMGLAQVPGGRVGDAPSEGLSASLRTLGLQLDRFKTGTPPRLEGHTIDYRRCEEQPSEVQVGPLSRRTARATFPVLPQRSTYITRTTPATHGAVLGALDRSPLTTGRIGGKGPRYCPSLEQKVVGYPDRTSHLVYLEPEGSESTEVYPAGLSTSLPPEVQLQLLRTIPGLERVELKTPGYAVEYDYLRSGQLSSGLEVRSVPGLFCAGQINGSSGYEEAAGQGLVAGVNAARRAAGRAAWVPARESSYLGVLCDDLSGKAFVEPYRLLPSRAIHRLQLREDNAFVRLGGLAVELGLTDAVQGEQWRSLLTGVAFARASLGSDAERWLRVPSRTLAEAVAQSLAAVPHEVAEAVFHAVRYAPYVEQRAVAQDRLEAFGATPVPSDLGWGSIVGLSAEARAALERCRPTSLGEASRLAGVDDQAIAVLAAHLRRRARLGVPRGTLERAD